jgi:hypothetical protein
VSRGGATNSPAAVYALTKYIDWMKKYSPKEAIGMTFGEAGPVPAQGQIAQRSEQGKGAGFKLYRGHGVCSFIKMH